MSDKMFNFLNKYYVVSKKYFPLILLGLVFGLSFVIKNLALMVGIYALVSFLHLGVLLLLRHVLQKEILKSINIDDLQIEGGVVDNENDKG